MQLECAGGRGVSDATEDTIKETFADDQGRGEFIILYECDVTCPGCFETFTVTGPSPQEVPTEWDYDCEICCRPMTISFHFDGDTVSAEAFPAD